MTVTVTPAEPAPDPCRRCFGESRQAYQAWAVYRDLGQTRSYQRVANALAKSMTLIKRWGSRWRWQDRAGAWDDALDAYKCERTLQAVEETSERQAAVLTLVMEKGVQRLCELDPRDMNPRQTLDYIMQAIAMYRAVTGQAARAIKGQQEGSESPAGVGVEMTVVRTRQDIADAIRQAEQEGRAVLKGGRSGDPV
jgi:hypothetical protein